MNQSPLDNIPTRSHGRSAPALGVAVAMVAALLSVLACIITILILIFGGQ